MAYHEINRSFENRTEVTGRKRGRNAVRPRRASLRSAEETSERKVRPAVSLEKTAETDAVKKTSPVVVRKVGPKGEVPGVRRTKAPADRVRKVRAAAETAKVEEKLVPAVEAAEETIVSAAESAVSEAQILVPAAEPVVETVVSVDPVVPTSAKVEEVEITEELAASEETAAPEENAEAAQAETAEEPMAEETADDHADQPDEAEAKIDADEKTDAQVKADVEEKADAEADVKEETPKAAAEPKKDEEPEETDVPVEKKSGNGGGKILKGALILLAVEAAALYVGGFLFFRNHFFPDTRINGANVGMMTAGKAEEMLNAAVPNEYYTLLGSDGSTSVLDLSSAGIRREYHDSLNNMLASQQPAAWPAMLIGEKNASAVSDNISFDADMLNACTAPLMELGEEPQNACIANGINRHGYVVVREQIGTKLDPEAFAFVLQDHIERADKMIDLAAEGCYKKPEITADNEELFTEAKRLGALDRFDAAINIGAGDALILRGEKLSDVLADSNAAVKLANELGDLLDTVPENGERPYYTFDGKQVIIKTGYGWKMNREETAESIQHMLDAVNNALEGQMANQKEPEVLEAMTDEYYRVEPIDGAYTAPSVLGAVSSGMQLTEWDEKYGCNATAVWEQEAASHRGRDIGENYAEVDITAQKVRLFQEGTLVLETPCVTGLERSAGRATPAGIFAVFGKTMHKVLTGYNPDGTISYQSPVTYWMPFNKNIGFHDATWRGAFGGNIYLSSGSHGCVNLPKKMAEKLYSIIQKKWTVVVYRT